MNYCHEKSYVSLEQRACLVCGATFDTGAILLDKRLRPSMKRHTVTGWGLCPEHERLFSEGYVALVECDPARSGVSAATDRVKPEQVYRTGRLAHVKREAFARMFKAPISAEQACVYVDPGVIPHLQAMIQPVAE